MILDVRLHLNNCRIYFMNDLTKYIHVLIIMHNRGDALLVDLIRIYIQLGSVKSYLEFQMSVK